MLWMMIWIKNFFGAFSGALLFRSTVSNSAFLDCFSRLGVLRVLPSAEKGEEEELPRLVTIPFLGSRIVIRPDRQPSSENGIGGAGVVAIYKLGFPELVGQKQPVMGGGGNRFRSDAIFEEIRERAAQEADLAKQVGSSYKFVISSGVEKREWTVDLKSSPPFVGPSQEAGQGKPAEVEIALMSDDMLVELAQGKAKPDQAFMQGKMKIRGNIMKAMRLKQVLDPSKLRARI